MDAALWLLGWLPSANTAYAMVDALVLTLAAAAAVIAGRNARGCMPSGPITQCLTAMLAVFAFNQGGSASAASLRLLAIGALPMLAQHPVGCTVFQLTNMVYLHRATHSDYGSMWYRGAAASMHAALILANLDPQSQATLRYFSAKLVYVQELHLIRLGRLRELTLDDIWQLPGRFSLRTVHGEFRYNDDEPLFMLRAIVRMIWRPLVPLVLVNTLLDMLMVVQTFAETRILRCIDAPADYRWYHGYSAALTVMLVALVKRQHPRLQEHIRFEINRASRAMQMELFRMPLIRGNQWMSSTRSSPDSYVRNMKDGIYGVLSLFTDVITLIAALATIYHTIGTLTLIPVGVHVVVEVITWGFRALVGPWYHWDRSWRDNYDGKVDQIYHNIKAIKLFGWERMYLDPELQQDHTDEDALPWYAPIIRFTWSAIYLASELGSELSAYLVVHAYMQSGSLGAIVTTSADLFQLSTQIGNVIINIGSAQYRLRIIKQAFTANASFERDIRSKSASGLQQMGDVAGKTGPSIAMHECSYVWHKRARKPVLQDISFSAAASELVAVVGKTGAGKSSLLLSICGELEMTAGSGGVVGTIGYLEQLPWIMNATMRANVLFGRDYDCRFFNKVVQACALTEDIARWPDGDLTIIGERGVNISGGQRARLALARTLYSRADIYVLDDPLSAVDAHVKRHILDHVLLDSGMLAGKLRIVSTNSANILPFAHQIVTLEDGRAAVAQQTPQVHQLAAVPPTSPDGYSSECPTVINTAPSTPTTASPASDSSDPKEDTPTTSTMETARHVLRLCGVLVLVAIAAVSQIGPVSEGIVDGLQLKTLRESGGSLDGEGAFQHLQLTMLRAALERLISSFKEFARKLLMERFLVGHIKGMFVACIIRAPLSLYDSTTRAHLSSAYNNGAQAVSYTIPMLIINTLECMSGIAFSVYHVGRSAPQLLLMAPLIAWAVSKINAYLAPTSDMLFKIQRKADVVSRGTSNIIADGKRMIRLFGVESYFTELYVRDNDASQRIILPAKAIESLTAMASTTIRQSGDMIIACMLLFQSQMSGYQVSSGEFVTYQRLLRSLVRDTSQIIYLPNIYRRFAKSMEVYRQYTDIEPEAPLVVEDCRPPPNWPHAGKIEFCDFTLRYREDLDPALDRINLTINPGEKIGIVGRTGAGKSTLVKTLFRLVHGTTSGTIRIDGLDINSMGVGDLRPRLGIIPQESTMFSGSFRRNLDPLREYTVEDMWAALIKSGIAPKVSPPRVRKDGSVDDDEYDEYYEESKAGADEWWAKSGWMMRLLLLLILDWPQKQKFTRHTPLHGLDRIALSSSQSFSDGQQQLFSFCRVLMRKRRVIVLDEATADVDLETDKHMQQLIRNEFSDLTVLTIAHRLETVMNSDRIIVMDQGRIAEFGSPQELIDAGGMFADLIKTNDFGA